jgi:hypothetical protein
MPKLKLFMVLIGCKPKGRFTEQHDVFFGIADSLAALVPQLKHWWPEAADKQAEMHIDAWREVTQVGPYAVEVYEKSASHNNEASASPSLFFLNLGGYKPGEFEEYHYKMLVAADNVALAIKQGKSSAFFKHAGFKGAPAHVDDKYGLDADDVYPVEEMLDPAVKNLYGLRLKLQEGTEDDLKLGYLLLKKIKVK